MANLNMGMITSGAFSTKGKGNYSAKTPSGDRLYIAKAIMAAIGATVEHPASFPFYALYKDKVEHNVVDAAGVATAEVFTIDNEVTSVFKTKAEMIEAYNSSKSLAIEATAALNSTATAAGLSPELLKQLAETVF